MQDFLSMIVFPLISSYMCESPILASYLFDRAFQRSFYAYIKYLTAFPRKVTVIKRYWAVITSQHLYKNGCRVMKWKGDEGGKGRSGPRAKGGG